MSRSDKTTILLVSTSDLWTVSVRSLLASLPDIELLDTAHGSLTAYQTVLEKQPHLLIIDDSLPADEVQVLVTMIKAKTFTPYCIWVVPTARRKKLGSANVADAIVNRSSPSEQLVKAVKSACEQINVAGPSASTGKHGTSPEI